MSTTIYWWAICTQCDWSGPDEPTRGAAYRDAEDHACDAQHDTIVMSDTSDALRFG
jgi:hypothetical protein